MFGGDPNPGQPKQCYCRSRPKISLSNFCAREGGACSCKGKVYFGTYKSIMQEADPMFGRVVTKNRNQVTLCNKTVFGDPLPAQRKDCYCETIKNHQIQMTREAKERQISDL